MNVALDQQTRTALERFIQRSRRLLEDDLSREAEGRFGIHVADGEIEDEEGLHLDPTGLAARRDVVEILGFLRKEEGKGAEAVARLVREAAFTHLNRLVAIRIAESISLLPESLANGSFSSGFRELLEVAPLLAHDAAGGYWRYLRLCGDELAADLPQLFDPRNPLLELAPSAGAFDELVKMIGATDLNAVWDAPDALGWAYQFFNSGDERRAMRDASASPRTSRELAVRNQFFTPRYVVDFLVHNSLGRRLLEADPCSALAEYLPMLLDPPTEKGAPLELSNVRVLDPACGSGHFLLGAYDVLERAWELQGVSPSDAAPEIVASLWGIDIDARCSQVAAAAVVLRARRHCKIHDLPVPNIMTARALPEPTEGWDALLDSLPRDRRQLVVSIRDALDQAPVLGSLLKVEEILSTEIRSRVIGADDDPLTLFGASGMANDAFGRAEGDVLALLQRVADNATSGPADRLFAAEAQDAMRFVDAMRGRYDAVLMNPPFGEPVASTKGYLKSAYPWLPWKDFNLFAIFVGRGLELCNPDGSVGAITSRVGLFLKTFQAWREEVVLGNRLTNLVDLGLGVMEQALVEAAAYTISRSAAVGEGTFIRLLREPDRATALPIAAARARTRLNDERVFRVAQVDFADVEGSPIAYWLSDSIRSLFRSLPKLEHNGADVRQGLATGDDFRFVRTAWEVSPSDIGTDLAATYEKKWVPFAKGGDYSPFWADLHLVVNWGANGEDMKAAAGSVVRNPQYYFLSGLTWPTRTASGFGPRLLPEGTCFANKGNGIFPALGTDHYLLLAWLTSRVARAALESMVAAADSVTSGGAAKSYEVGLVQKLPWPGDALAGRADIVAAIREIVEMRRKIDFRDETSASFIRVEIPTEGESLSALADRRLRVDEVRFLRSLNASAFIDIELAKILGLDQSGLSYLDEEVGPHPMSYPSAKMDEERVKTLYQLPMENMIGELIKERGGSSAVANLTYVADRRIEVLSHGIEANPASIIDLRQRSQIMPPEELTGLAEDLFSYLVGLAFGRWNADVALGSVENMLASDLLSPRRPCSPGMLTGEDDLPLDSVPSGYPLQMPPGRLFVDEAGHEWDIAVAIERASSCLFIDADFHLQDLLSVLGSRSVRTHLRSKYFKEHLSRYSKSRRKAPLYWPLTVPSGRWGVWVYAPFFSRETLFAVAAQALRREAYAEAEISRLERERSGGGLRGAKGLDKALDDERKLAEELRRFRENAQHVAGLGWEPDLDDGIVLCAAPLADLFPNWKDLAQSRTELRAGKHEWATVARWAGDL